GSRLYVLQGRSLEYVYPTVYDPDNYKPVQTNAAVYVLSVFDTAQLPALPLLASTQKESEHAQYLYGRYEGLEVKPGLLVWATGEGGGMPWWGWRVGPVLAIDAAAPARSAGMVADIAMPFWYGGGSGHFIAVDTTAS